MNIQYSTFWISQLQNLRNSIKYWMSEHTVHNFLKLSASKHKEFNEILNVWAYSTTLFERHTFKTKGIQCIEWLSILCSTFWSSQLQNRRNACFLCPSGWLACGLSLSLSLSLAGWLAGWLAGFLCLSLTGWLAGWLTLFVSLCSLSISLWLAGWLALSFSLSLSAISLSLSLAGWLAGSLFLSLSLSLPLAGWLAGWLSVSLSLSLAGWLACWLAGWLLLLPLLPLSNPY